MPDPIRIEIAWTTETSEYGAARYTSLYKDELNSTTIHQSNHEHTLKIKYGADLNISNSAAYQGTLNQFRGLLRSGWSWMRTFPFSQKLAKPFIQIQTSIK